MGKYDAAVKAMEDVNVAGPQAATSSTPHTYELRTEVKVYRDETVVLIVANDAAGTYLHVPGEGVTLPTGVLYGAMERAGVLSSPLAPLARYDMARR